MSVADIKMGGAYVEAYMKDDGVRKGIDGIASRMASLGRTIASIGAATAGVGIAIRAPLEAAARIFSDAGSELVKLSKETGYTTEALSELKYAADQSNLSMEEVLKQVKEGKNDFAGLRAEARKLGVVMFGDDAQAADQLRQALASMSYVLKSITVQIGAAVAPVIKQAALELREWAVVALRWIQNHREMFATLAKIGAAVVAVGTGFTFLGGAISAAGTALGVVSTAISFILSPMGLVIAAVGAAGYAFFKFTDAGKATLVWFSQQWPRLRDTVMGTVQGIANALKAGDILLAAKVLWAGVKVVFFEALDSINKVWLGSFRQLGMAGINAVFGIADRLNAAIVVMQKYWVEFSTFVIDKADFAWTKVATTILRQFAYAITELDHLWTQKWGILAGIAETTIKNLANAITYSLKTAFVTIAEFAATAITSAVRKPLEILASIPGVAEAMGAKVALGLLGSPDAANKAVRDMLGPVVKPEKEEFGKAQGDGLAGMALKKASELDQAFRQRHANRPGDVEQGKFEAENEGAIRGQLLGDLQKTLEDMLFKINPAINNDPALQKARDELKAALEAAKLAAQNAKNPDAVAALKAGVAGVEKGRSSVGTFSAFQAAQLGADSPMKPTEKKLDQLVNINGEMLQLAKVGKAGPAMAGPQRFKP